MFGERRLSCSARDAAVYLAHTGRGQSLRAIAAVTKTHPSTVLRTVRRVEERRDDPLLDRILDDLEAALGEEGGAPLREDIDASIVEREARRYLRRLCEPGSFLLVADGADKAGVFCAANHFRRPIAMFDVDLAAAFLRRDWIRIVQRGTATVRYRITDVGRAYLRRALAAAEPVKAATPPDAFAAQHRLEGERIVPDPVDGEPVSRSVNLGESVLGWLAKRRGPDGKPYLG
ncbi:MAG: helix-turn-helix domain-containing protein, partial [Pseudomonadota bacterium]